MIGKKAAGIIIAGAAMVGAVGVAAPAQAASWSVKAYCFRPIGTDNLEWGGTSTGTGNVIARLYDRNTLVDTIGKEAGSTLVSITKWHDHVVGGGRFSVTAFTTKGGQTKTNTCHVS
jgi:hypothetical protein